MGNKNFYITLAVTVVDDAGAPVLLRDELPTICVAGRDADEAVRRFRESFERLVRNDVRVGMATVV